MIVADEVYAIAVALGKSENMRVTAGRKFADLWVYVTAPGNDGAQQMVDAGYDPTQKNLWYMIVMHPSYPQALGTSWSTGKRVLAIGRASDPAAADQEERQSRADAHIRRKDAATEAASVTQHPRSETFCNKGGSEPASSADLEALVAAVKLLSTQDFDRFRAWFRGYCGT
jgi:hypothetical protein